MDQQTVEIISQPAFSNDKEGFDFLVQNQILSKRFYSYWYGRYGHYHFALLK